jgi:hypothetical protein
MIERTLSSEALVTVYQSTCFYIPEGLLWKPQISNVLICFRIVNLSVINISWSEVLYTYHVLPCSVKWQHKYHVREYILDTKRGCFTLLSDWVGISILAHDSCIKYYLNRER